MHSGDMTDVALIARGRLAAASGEGRLLRERCHLHMSIIAEHLGVSVNAVKKWERGEALPGPDHAQAYARLLDELRDVLDREATS